MNFFKKGFTLVEVLVATFIIGVLSTVILLNYRTGQDQASLTRSAAAFETEIRRAQNLAISSAELSGTQPCGYGIHYVDKRNYSIYAGKLGGAASCQVSNHNFQSGIDSVYQSVKIIEQRAVFKNSFSDIFFEPPDPTTYINNDNSVGISAIIDFCLETDLNKCRTITVKRFRLITQ